MIREKAPLAEEAVRPKKSSSAKYYIAAAVIFWLILGSALIYYLVYAKGQNTAPKGFKVWTGKDVRKHVRYFLSKTVHLEPTGNSSFLNSVIQMLYHDDAFRTELERKIHMCHGKFDSEYSKRLKAWNDLFLKMDESYLKIVKPDLKALLPAELATGQEQDASLVLSSIFRLRFWKGLVFEVDTVHKKTYSDQDVIEDRSDEYYLPLVIKIPEYTPGAGVPSLQYLVNSQLPLTNSPVPVSEGQREKGVQKIEAHRLSFDAPYSFIIKLDRFPNNGKKIKTPVDVPTKLEIKHPQNGQIAHYKLHSFIVHSGESANSGHYRTYVTLTGRDYTHFNDLHELGGLSPAYVQADKEAAYILLYELEKLVLPEKHIPP